MWCQVHFMICHGPDNHSGHYTSADPPMRGLTKWTDLLAFKLSKSHRTQFIGLENGGGGQEYLGQKLLL